MPGLLGPHPAVLPVGKNTIKGFGLDLGARLWPGPSGLTELQSPLGYREGSLSEAVPRGLFVASPVSSSLS